MISKMNKLTFLIYHKEYDDFLNKLQQLGVVHIVTRQEGEPDETILNDMHMISMCKSVIHEMSLLAGEIQQDPTNASVRTTEIQDIFDAFEQKKNHIQELVQQQTVIQRELSALSPWGDFDKKDIERIAKAGWRIQFYTCLERNFEENWIDQYNAIEINREAGRIYFVIVTPQIVELDAEPVILPEQSISQLKSQLALNEREIDMAKKDLAVFSASSISLLQKGCIAIQDSLEVKQVRLSGQTMADGALLLLEGWVPQENQDTVVNLLQQNGVYYEMRHANKEDQAPIKLKNNAFVRLYELITKMYGMPEYNEFDPTPIVAPFFTLFFAYCVGDAGYGLVLILLGFYLKKKMSTSMRGMMNLVISLGIATTILGTIFSTFFGVTLVNVNAPWLDGLKSIMISGKVPGTTFDKQMVIALGIGIVHIIVAMTVKALVATYRFGFKNALSEWGWLLGIVGFIATGGLMYLDRITPPMAQTTFIIIGSIAAIGIYLLNNLQRNILINIGAGLWDTYNMATGLLGDVLSYIRLYALGLAGAMLGMVFNQLAFMIHINIESAPIVGSILTWICCGLILIFGHTLNIAMSCLSGFVHPLRLTFVEYFKNSSYGGTGIAYKPFKETKTE